MVFQVMDWTAIEASPGGFVIGGYATNATTLYHSSLQTVNTAEARAAVILVYGMTTKDPMYDMIINELPSTFSPVTKVLGIRAITVQYSSKNVIMAVLETD